MNDFMRMQLLRVYDFTCQYCNTRAVHKEELEVDHIHPKSLGGEDKLANYTVACLPCNRKKLNSTLGEPGKSLLLAVAERKAGIIKKRLAEGRRYRKLERLFGGGRNTLTEGEVSISYIPNNMMYSRVLFYILHEYTVDNKRTFIFDHQGGKKYGGGFQSDYYGFFGEYLRENILVDAVRWGQSIIVTAGFPQLDIEFPSIISRFEPFYTTDKYFDLEVLHGFHISFVQGDQAQLSIIAYLLYTLGKGYELL